MKMHIRPPRQIAILLLTIGLAGGLHAQQVALTFDDLPRHGPLPPKVSRMDVVRELIAALKEAGVPASYGFVNAQKVKDDPGLRAVLELWRAADLPLGSHAYSHMNLHANSVEAFGQDIRRNEPLLEALMAGEDWRWFRYPFLRQGDTLEKRRGVRRFLSDRGYRIAEASLDFEDYLWNAPYARCVAAKDAPAIEWLESSYLEIARRYVTLGQELSNQVYGRDIRHVIVLHTGAFNARMLGRLLELLKGMGFELISLQQATSDPAYQVDWDVADEYGLTLLEQGMEAKQLDFPRIERKPVGRLRGLCR